ncbi:hypothetical protein L1887_28839 [Cichorium endivia]|nr:hypothetical protein L1887_28839 [Cichorium endivia]
MVSAECPTGSYLTYKCNRCNHNIPVLVDWGEKQPLQQDLKRFFKIVAAVEVGALRALGFDYSASIEWNMVAARELERVWCRRQSWRDLAVAVIVARCDGHDGDQLVVYLSSTIASFCDVVLDVITTFLVDSEEKQPLQQDLKCNCQELLIVIELEKSEGGPIAVIKVDDDFSISYKEFDPRTFQSRLKWIGIRSKSHLRQ